MKLLLNLMKCDTFYTQKKQGLCLEGILSNYRRARGLGMQKPKRPIAKENAWPARQLEKGFLCG